MMGITVLGTELLARANPDGYTLGLLATSLAVNAGLPAKTPYDPLRDFAPITLAVDTPLIIVVPASLSARTLPALPHVRSGQLRGLAVTTAAISAKRNRHVDQGDTAGRHQAEYVIRKYCKYMFLKDKYYFRNLISASFDFEIAHLLGFLHAGAHEKSKIGAG